MCDLYESFQDEFDTEPSPENQQSGGSIPLLYEGTMIPDQRVCVPRYDGSAVLDCPLDDQGVGGTARGTIRIRTIKILNI